MMHTNLLVLGSPINTATQTDCGMGVRCRAMFCKDLPQSTTDDIEFRVCADGTKDQ